MNEKHLIILWGKTGSGRGIIENALLCANYVSIEGNLIPYLDKHNRIVYICNAPSNMDIETAKQKQFMVQFLKCEKAL